MKYLQLVDQAPLVWTGRQERVSDRPDADALVMSPTQKGARKGKRGKCHPQNEWERSVKWLHLEQKKLPPRWNREGSKSEVIFF